MLEKKKNIYCAFPDMKEIIIKKSVKTGETPSRIINFVYSFIPKIQSGYCVYFIELKWFCINFVMITELCHVEI